WKLFKQVVKNIFLNFRFLADFFVLFINKLGRKNETHDCETVVQVYKACFIVLLKHKYLLILFFIIQVLKLFL
ncbi:MAG: hypothetical protein ACK55Z_01075, partial [bacterium]